MTKSQKIADEIVKELSKARFENPLFTDKQISTAMAIIIKPYLEHIHNEAVLATVMAKNHQKYEEPKYID